MAGSYELVINNLLCFLASARSDCSKAVLLEIIDSFYCHDKIKAAKKELTNILNKDLGWRRDPDKEQKDLKDVIESKCIL